MEHRTEIRQWKLIIFVIILFFVSMVNSCTELRYSVSGKTAEGTLTGAQETRTSRRTTGVIVTYAFTAADGKQHKGRETVSHRRAAELSGTAPEVTYLPSSPETNTLTAERSALWPIIFGVMVLAMGVVVYRLHREAHGM